VKRSGFAKVEATKQTKGTSFVLGHGMLEGCWKDAADAALSAVGHAHQPGSSIVQPGRRWSTALVASQLGSKQFGSPTAEASIELGP
jgi:hypothetical protein